MSASMRFSTALFATLALSACSLLPERRGGDERAQRPRPAATSAPVATSREAQQCTRELTGSRASFSPLPDAYYGAGCATVNSVRLTALAADGGMLDVSNLAVTSCPLALTFAGWARYGVDRAARQILGSPLARIETFGSYSCRNVAGSSRRSAHATAQAIDVSAFVMADGRRITLSAGWDGSAEEREFLRTIQASACRRFGTVLGPDYNAAHRDHFHLEEGGGGFCR